MYIILSKSRSCESHIFMTIASWHLHCKSVLQGFQLLKNACLFNVTSNRFAHEGISEYVYLFFAKFIRKHCNFVKFVYKNGKYTNIALMLD